MRILRIGIRRQRNAIVVSASSDVRDARLTALVSHSESVLIAKYAGNAGLSISAYLRARALGEGDDGADKLALQQVDALLGKMEHDLDSATAELSETLARIAAR